MKKTLNLLLLTLISFWSMSVSALELKRSTDKVEVSLYTNYNDINPKQNLEVLIKFTMKNGWHIFSQQPGDIGLPTTVDWKIPLSFELSEQSWSLDEKFVNEDIVQYGYSKTAYYKAVIIPSGDVFNKVRLEAEINWLACKDECIPEKTTFYLDMPVTGNDLRPTQQWDKVIQKAQHSFVPRIMEMEVNVWLAILMAFIGGIILNFMPCIFPILTLKAISLAESPYNKKKSRIEAAFYTAGVVISFIVIATILVLLRKQGEDIGWGFQLQSPTFISVMIVIFFLIFLMLLDVVNIPNPLINKVGRVSFKKHMWNSFFTGFFAVLIASPCTAPFMGIAIGYTLAAPLYVYYPVFISLSLGYALPFAMAGLFPKAIHKVLPRPGKWMDILKKIFAIPVLLTCIWLIWVLYNQLDAHYEKSTSQLNWRNYNPIQIAELVDKKEPVFVDFTAKWCITCLVNKKVALQSEKFAKLVKTRKINLFRADWTNHDDNIAAALERYGRNSIPLYIYYNGKDKKYEILPQLLTPGILEDHLE